LCSHQQKLQNIKHKLKEAETGGQEAQVETKLCLTVCISVMFRILKVSFCHLVLLATCKQINQVAQANIVI